MRMAQFLHLLAPLTRLTGKSVYEWTEECTTAFKEMKAVMAADVMIMIYPNINLPFDVYTDASDYQMGAVIMQQSKPVAYWSRKLDAAQQNYSTMEKEMLAVVHCFQEFRSMLFGAKINVFTDHKTNRYDYIEISCAKTSNAVFHLSLSRLSEKQTPRSRLWKTPCKTRDLHRLS